MIGNYSERRLVLGRRSKVCVLLCLGLATTNKKRYNHSVTMGRSENVWGPYEPDPIGAIVTSQPQKSNERADYDHLKPKYYNPDSELQKSGHGSYVNLDDDEAYLVHLTARPFVVDEADDRSRYRCTLGRETAIQKMIWTKDGWLRMADGSNLAKVNVEEPKLAEYPVKSVPTYDDFDSEELGIYYYSPRISANRFCDLKSKEGFLRIRGGEALTSLNSVSLLCRKLTSVNAIVTTKVHFEPETFQHSAGLVIYYDNMNYSYLRIYYSETLNSSAIMLQQMENGNRKQWLDERTAIDSSRDIFMKLKIEGREIHFEWSYDGKIWNIIGPKLDISMYSDEYCKYGEFTGTMVGMACIDRLNHSKCAEFDFFEYKDINN